MSSPETFDLLVIGAGPGGYVAAVRAAELGMKTACVEKDSEPGGVCLRVGCIPSKALLESTEYLDFARNRFTEHGISAGNLSMDLVKLMERKNSIVSGLAGKCPQLLEENKVRLSTERPGSGPATKSKCSGGREGAGFSARSILLATGSEPVLLPFSPWTESM